MHTPFAANRRKQMVGAAIGGVVNLVSGLVNHKIDNVGEGYAYFGVGALAGAASECARC